VAPLLESTRLLAAVTRIIADKCVAGIEADVEATTRGGILK
jgi:fumarate hydratase class II